MRPDGTIDRMDTVVNLAQKHNALILLQSVRKQLEEDPGLRAQLTLPFLAATIRVLINMPRVNYVLTVTDEEQKVSVTYTGRDLLPNWRTL